MIETLITIWDASAHAALVMGGAFLLAGIAGTIFHRQIDRYIWRIKR